jgi:hypothetical protein
LATKGGRSLHFLAAAEPHAPVCGAQAAAQVCVDDADDLIDLVVRQFRLAETLDEGGALERVDATRGGIAARLGLLDEARSSTRGAALGGITFQRFAHDLFRARADLKCEEGSVTVVAPRGG